MSVFTNPAAASREQAQAYTAALLDLLGTADPMTVLRQTPFALKRAVEGLGETQMSVPEAPSRWSIRQVVRHLADSDLIWAWRLRLVLAQDRPPITGYDQDAWAQRLGYEQDPAAESLEEFTVVRRGNLRVLGRAKPEDLQRVGIHAERGEESVEHMMKLYAAHDLLHLRQIERIRGAVQGR